MISSKLPWCATRNLEGIPINLWIKFKQFVGDIDVKA